ncbi:MAG: hypothetical protein COA42_03355 [Alteromonadaceae bacterium]|nr:MAG: hypothetical protein COA42_03355 [Alteromonadaceae bacterium]
MSNESSSQTTDELEPRTTNHYFDKVKSLFQRYSFLLIFVALYLGYTEFQSALGRQALKNTGISMLSLDEAIIKAKLENKLVLADISAIWCPSCRKLDNNVLANPRVRESIEQNYVFARVEYESDEGEAFMHKYDVRGFPTLLVLDQEGAKIRKLGLTFDPDVFIQMIKI